MKKRYKAGLVLLILLLLLPAFWGCTRNRWAVTALHTEPITEEAASVWPAWPALALLKTGANPLWFELGSTGPVHIISPAAAALPDFKPWPHARHITGILHWESFLVMLVNRDGFLVFKKNGNDNGEELLLYRVADRQFWNDYTAESLFIWDDRPLALLYRNDFFSPPAGISPNPQVFTLDTLSPIPIGYNIGAFRNIPAGSEAEIVHKGIDDYWYYRVREKESAEAESQYFRTGGLDFPGERINVEQWRASYRSEEPVLNGFTLPPLDEGFTYTGFAIFENVMIASWEEQQDAGIGAAGFMLISRQR
ncbi:MAG: hypothetical protein FWG77_09155 [Treponema sp.]|nr:hypothetical protein [Treponema sp.]